MKYFSRILFAAVLCAFVFSTPAHAAVPVTQDETIVGTVVKNGKDFVLEADDGDYIVKGKDLSKMLGRLVEVTGKITESGKGSVIDAKTVEEVSE